MAFLEYTAVFWIAAGCLGSILASYVSIAEVLQLLQRQETDPLQIVTAVQRWLSTHSQWLLIWERALGPQHPDVAYALVNLANLYGMQGKYEQADITPTRMPGRGAASWQGTPGDTQGHA